MCSKHQTRDSAAVRGADHGEAAVPLQPMEVNRGAEIHLDPVEETPPQQVHTMESPHGRGLLAGPMDLWREKPILEKIYW